MASNVDAIRAATIGSKKKFAEEIVEIDENPDIKIVMKQLTIAQRQEASKHARLPDGDVDIFEWQIWCILLGSLDPDSGERVFQEEDYGELKSHPSGGFIEQLAAAATRVNIVLVEDEEAVEKNSDETS